jgi:hypothetical protein
MELPSETPIEMNHAREGSTNQIMKQHFQNIETLSDPEFNLFITSKQLKILKINNHYKFTHYNHTRFVNAYYYECPNCKKYITVEEYLDYYMPFCNLCL